MKVLMFTPTIKTSAIGHMACLVTQALIAQEHEVIIVRSEDKPLLNEPTHDFPTELVPWNQSKRIVSLISSMDTVIYHIGDNFLMHRGCLAWLPHTPGVICLHDFFLASLFLEWAKHHRSEAEEILRAWYGDSIAQQFFNYPDIDTFIQKALQTSPMTEWICAMATGVMTHSNEDIARVLQACPGPVYTVPLAYDIKILPTQVMVKNSDTNTLGDTQTWANTAFNADNYAQQLVRLAFSANKTGPMLNTVSFFTHILQSWGASETLLTLEDTLVPLTLFTHLSDLPS